MPHFFSSTELAMLDSRVQPTKPNPSQSAPTPRSGQARSSLDVSTDGNVLDKSLDRSVSFTFASVDPGNITVRNASQLPADEIERMLAVLRAARVDADAAGDDLMSF